MKCLCTGLLLLLVSTIFAQTISSKKSLREYCPMGRGQYKSTCFAYAPVYTALSIMKNREVNRTDSADKAQSAYSDCYVASKMNKDNRFWTKTFSCCGMNGTSLKALGFLKYNGTCKLRHFKVKCVKRTTIIEKAEDNLLKIKDYQVYLDANKYISSGNGTDGNYTSKEWIVKQLDNNVPVIVAPHQLPSFLNLKKEIWQPTDKDKELVREKVNPNHVVCIIGYGVDENNNVYFEIRNNYLNWGKNGFAYVKAEDFLLFVENAAVMKL